MHKPYKLGANPDYSCRRQFGLCAAAMATFAQFFPLRDVEGRTGVRQAVNQPPVARLGCPIAGVVGRPWLAMINAQSVEPLADLSQMEPIVSGPRGQQVARSNCAQNRVHVSQMPIWFCHSVEPSQRLLTFFQKRSEYIQQRFFVVLSSDGSGRWVDRQPTGMRILQRAFQASSKIFNLLITQVTKNLQHGPIACLWFPSCVFGG